MKDEAARFILHFGYSDSLSGVKGLWDIRRGSHCTGVQCKCRSAQNDIAHGKLFILFQVAHGADGLKFFFECVLFFELRFTDGFVGDNIQAFDPVDE
jgi:hypothetical protein